MVVKTNSNGANLGFEQKMWLAADKMRSNMDAAEYKHVVLGLIFLKYISDAFKEVHEELTKDKDSDPEERDEYKSRNVFWVPKESRWDYLQTSAKKPEIGKIIDDAMDFIEKENTSLRGVLPKDYARQGLNKQRLGELIDLVGTIGLGDKESKSKDILGRVYEYFLGQFADAEGKKGGQFYTPRCIVRLLVEMLEPYKGRIYDPCCGSGGMFVSSEKFVEAQGGKIGDISVYGQESNQTTWRLAKMNMAIRGIDANIQWGDTFHNDLHKDLRADFIIANPPFNQKETGVNNIQDDARWRYGIPDESKDGGNFAWIQHMIYHLSPTGTAGFVMANGAMSAGGRFGEIRKKIVEDDLVDCMVALPSQLFYNTPIKASLWFVTKDKKDHKFRNRTNSMLFIDASNMGVMVDSRHRELTEKDIKKISETYHAWRGENKLSYQDVQGFCKSIKREEVLKNKNVLNPNVYLSDMNGNVELLDFKKEIINISNHLEKKQTVLENLDKQIKLSLSENGYLELSKLNFKVSSSKIIERLAWLLFKEWFDKLKFSNGFLTEDDKKYSDEFNMDIPKEWETKPLDEIAKFLNGLALQKYPPEEENFLPVIKIKELKDGITKSTDKVSCKLPEEYIVRNGDVVFSWSGSLELVIWNNVNGALNQHLFRVTSIDYNKWFYYFWIKHYLSYFRGIASGKATTMGHIQKHHLSDVKVLVPDKITLQKMDSIMNPLIELYIILNEEVSLNTNLEN